MSYLEGGGVPRRRDLETGRFDGGSSFCPLGRLLAGTMKHAVALLLLLLAASGTHGGAGHEGVRQSKELPGLDFLPALVVGACELSR